MRIEGTLLALLAVAACSPSETPPEESQAASRAAVVRWSLAPPSPRIRAEHADYVQSSLCTGCHEHQAGLHRGSDHDLAMQRPSPDTVLGNFDSASLLSHGVRVSFTSRNGDFRMRLPDASGKRRSFRIAYVFGVEPLQQYLAEVTPGRLQALPFAWDTRPRAAGGQHWFPIHGDEVIAHDDPRHWTSPNQNWNHQCADCHSTNVEKGYNPTTETFATHSSELDVGCQACHGPGSEHVERARAGQLHDGLGLTRYFTRRSARSWRLDPKARIASLSRGTAAEAEVEVCAACHSLRSDLGRAPGASAFHDRYRLQLIEPPFYFADGQIKEEVYVYGSFLQSKMANAGVICTDCHDAHSGKIYVRGNALCNQCHRASVFDTQAHHFHPEGPGSECVACHMPQRTYKQVDARRDHHFGVPRPAESSTLDTPLACTACHVARTPAWAEAAIQKQRGASRSHVVPEQPEWPRILVAAREHQGGALARLLGLIQDPEAPDIIRASAVALLGEYGSARTSTALRALTHHTSSLLRRAVAQAAAALPPTERAQLLEPLLSDAVRSVRLEAVGALLRVRAAHWSAEMRKAFSGALVEFESSHQQNSDRAESLTALAELKLRQDDVSAAVSLLRQAIAREPSRAAAYLALADIERLHKNDATAQKTLLAALEIAKERAPLEHALGLSLVRSKQPTQALAHLAAAYVAEQGNRQYGLVYAIALAENDVKAGLSVLDALLQRYPAETSLLEAASEYAQQLGEMQRASDLQKRLQAARAELAAL